jgi:hypothetical protein
MVATAAESRLNIHVVSRLRRFHHGTNKKAPGSEWGFKDAPVYGIAPLNVQNYPKRKSTQTAVQKIQVIVQKKCNGHSRFKCKLSLG